MANSISTADDVISYKNTFPLTVTPYPSNNETFDAIKANAELQWNPLLNFVWTPSFIVSNSFLNCPSRPPHKNIV